MPTSYRPTEFTFNSYNWKGAAPYNRADVPTRWMGPTAVDRTVLEQQFAYEWLDSSSPYAQGMNPPFATSAAGRLSPVLQEAGAPVRILRGFIRRADYDNADWVSKCRLGFMYNPEQITRDYVSYLDQGALDPFNTVFQSGNLVAPPSYMDFSFSLFFDRQQEATDAAHPGVFVDYEYFDLVVRNVVPVGRPDASSVALPDNGVMMVNPRDITVVFSPQLTVQGRPSNARVTFQRFTHRMVPTRMTIDLTMRVTYFGPMKEMVEYAKVEAITEGSVAWREDMGATFTLDRTEINEFGELFKEWAYAQGGLLTEEQRQQLLGLTGGAAALIPGAGAALGLSGTINSGAASSVADFALQQANTQPCVYVGASGPRHNLWAQCDCSSFVWGAFADYNDAYATSLGWPTFAEGTSGRRHVPATGGMIPKFLDKSSPCEHIFTVAHTRPVAERAALIKSNIHKIAKGDLLFRSPGLTSGVGHVAIILGWEGTPGSSLVRIVDAASPSRGTGPRTISVDYISTDYNHCFRPLVGAPNALLPAGSPPAPQAN